jgi:RimJ/RimL family protein N-acetyltransferase
VRLLAARDAHFAWMLGESDAPDGLRLPHGGVDQPWVLRWLRRGLRQRGRRQWLMLAGGEVVGACGYKAPPNEVGEAEIGYGVAPERRRRGFATRAVDLLLEAARDDAQVRVITAQTALDNLPSQRVLEANGFAAIGRAHDADEGEMIVWRLELSQKRDRRPNR